MPIGISSFEFLFPAYFWQNKNRGMPTTVWSDGHPPVFQNVTVDFYFAIYFHAEINYNIGIKVKQGVVNIKKAEIINRLLQENSGIFDTAGAIQAGVSKTTLAQLVKSGVLERVSHGKYIGLDFFPDELSILQQRSDKIIFSRETALFYMT